jgi:hypothetical protein
MTERSFISSWLMVDNKYVNEFRRMKPVAAADFGILD